MADRTPSKIKKSNLSGLTWAKNVGKSLGYSAMDMIEEMMPSTVGMVSANKDMITSSYNFLKSFRGKNTKRLDDLLTGAAKENYNTLKKAIKNAKEDIKSGNIYNKSRQDSMFDDDFDLGDLDVDVDYSDDYGDDSFDSGDGSPSVVVPNITVNSNITKNNPMVKAVERQNELIAEEANATAARDVNLARSMIMVNQDIGQELHGGLQSINENLSLLVNFHSSNMTKYITASLKYYEDQLKITTEVLDEYKKVHTKEEKEQKTKTDPVDELFGSNGELDIGAYGKLIKKQLIGVIDSNMITSSIKMMFEDTSTLASIASAPLKFISDSIVKKFIPSFLEESLKRFDDTLSGFFPALLYKLTGLRGNDNPLFDLIGQVFGISSKNKKNVDLGLYEKGKVDFDGITRKSIVTVIPGLLSKIYSALSGKSELSFNYKTGQFQTVEDIRETFKKDERDAVLGQYSTLSEMKSRLDAFKLNNEKEKKELSKMIDDTFYRLTDSNGLRNPNKRTKGGIEIDDLAELSQGTPQQVEIIRSIINSMTRGDIMKTFGIDALNARKARTGFYEDIETSPDNAYSVLFNELYSDKNALTTDNPLLKVYGKGKKAKASIFNPSDNYGKTTTDYLRDIKRILIDGIIVFDGGRARPSIRKRGTDMDEYEKANDYTTKKDEERRQTVSATNIPGGYDSIVNLPEDPKEREKMINEWVEDQKEKENNKPGKFNIGKFLTGNLGDKFKTVQDFFHKIFTFPANAISKFFDKVDNTLYSIIFGNVESEDGEKKSFFEHLLGKITTGFSSFFTFLKDKIFTPIHDALLGEKGLITKIKESEMWKSLTSKANKFVNYLFGDRNADGFRAGGLFSDTANEVGDMFKGFKYYFTGKEYTDSKGNTYSDNENSVFGNVKSMFTSFKTTLKEYFFGEDDDKESKVKGVLTEVKSSIKSGFQNFMDAIFGPKDINGKRNKGYVNVDELTEKVKERAPKALAHGMVGAGVGLLGSMGGLGILGTMILGPFSGAVMGVASSFLFQSDKFKNWLFGEYDENTGERVGGFIDKETQNFFKKHKTAMVGGATVGAVKGMLGIGILPSFILGGPLSGALFGMASSMLFRSEKFQNWLFGNKQDDGTRIGGILNKITGKVTDADTKKKLGTVGAGILGGAGLGFITSNFGILGALSIGPVGGALAGAAAGIALTSDKWKNYLFGEFDEETGEKKGGLLTKFANLISVEALQPLKVQALEWKFGIQNWFEEKIAEPFIDSLAPLRESLTRFKDSMRNLMHSLWEGIKNNIFVKTFKEGLVDPIIEGFRDYVFKPFKTIGKLLIQGTGKVIGTVASAPFKMLSFVADRLAKSHMSEGISSVRHQIIENIKNSEFVVGAKKILEPITNAVDTVVDYTKKGISSVFGFTKKLIKAGVKLFFKGVGFTLLAPFKAIAAPFKAIGAVKNFMKNRDVGVKNQGGLNDIYAGNRGLVGSIGDLLQTFNPFSTIRNDSKYHAVDRDSVKEGIRKRLENNGQTVSDEELERLTDETMRQHHGGAFYESERRRARRERKEKRDARKQQQQDLLNDMKSQLNYNQQLAKSLGYDNFDTEGKYSGSIYKDIDKQMISQYGKEYKSKSKMERDEFKRQLVASKTNDKIKENTENTVEELKKINKVMDYLRKTGGKLFKKPGTDDDDERRFKIKMPGQAKSADDPANTADNPAHSHEDGLDDVPFDGYKATLHKGEAVIPKKKKGVLSRLKSTGEKASSFMNKFTSSIGAVFSKSLEAEDARDYAEELERSKAAEDEKERKEKRSFTTRKTASFLKEERAKEAEKEEERSFRSKVLGYLGNTAVSMKNHASNWLDMFGKKGLIGAGLMMALPWLIDFFKDPVGKLAGLFNKGMDGLPELLGFTDKDGDRTNSTGGVQLNNDAIEASVRGTVYTAKKIAANADSIAKGAKNIYGSIKSKFVKNADEVVEGAGKAIGAQSDEVVEAVTKNKGVLTKFKEIAKKAVDNLTEMVNKAIQKHGGKGGLSSIKTVLTKLTTNLSDNILIKFIGRIGTAVGKIAGSAATLMMSDVAWGTWGAISGATKAETANLFGVSEKDATPGMRIVSSIMKSILSISWFFVIDLLNDIAKSVSGTDILQMLAETIYKIISGENAAVKLDNAQASFDDEYKRYLQYQKELTGVDSKESKDSYSDRTNKTLASKIGGWFGSGFDAMKDRLVGQKGDSTKYNEAVNQKNKLDQMLSSNPNLMNDSAFKTTYDGVVKSIKENETKNGLFRKFASGYTSNSVNYSIPAVSANIGGIGGVDLPVDGQSSVSTNIGGVGGVDIPIAQQTAQGGMNNVMQMLWVEANKITEEAFRQVIQEETKTKWWQKVLRSPITKGLLIGGGMLLGGPGGAIVGTLVADAIDRSESLIEGLKESIQPIVANVSAQISAAWLEKFRWIAGGDEYGDGWVKKIITDDTNFLGNSVVPAELKIISQNSMLNSISKLWKESNAIAEEAFREAINDETKSNWWDKVLHSPITKTVLVGGLAAAGIALAPVTAGAGLGLTAAAIGGGVAGASIGGILSTIDPKATLVDNVKNMAHPIISSISTQITAAWIDKFRWIAGGDGYSTGWVKYLITDDSDFLGGTNIPSELKTISQHSMSKAVQLMWKESNAIAEEGFTEAIQNETQSEWWDKVLHSPITKAVMIGGLAAGGVALAPFTAGTSLGVTAAAIGGGVAGASIGGILSAMDPKATLVENIANMAQPIISTITAQISAAWLDKFRWIAGGDGYSIGWVKHLITNDDDLLGGTGIPSELKAISQHSMGNALSRLWKESNAIAEEGFTEAIQNETQSEWWDKILHSPITKAVMIGGLAAGGAALAPFTAGAGLGLTAAAIGGGVAGASIGGILSAMDPKATLVENIANMAHPVIGSITTQISAAWLDKFRWIAGGDGYSIGWVKHLITNDDDLLGSTNIPSELKAISQHSMGNALSRLWKESNAIAEEGFTEAIQNETQSEWWDKILHSPITKTVLVGGLAAAGIALAPFTAGTGLGLTAAAIGGGVAGAGVGYILSQLDPKATLVENIANMAQPVIGSVSAQLTAAWLDKFRWIAGGDGYSTGWVKYLITDDSDFLGGTNIPSELKALSQQSMGNALSRLWQISNDITTKGFEEALKDETGTGWWDKAKAWWGGLDGDHSDNKNAQSTLITQIQEGITPSIKSIVEQVKDAWIKNFQIIAGGIEYKRTGDINHGEGWVASLVSGNTDFLNGDIKTNFLNTTSANMNEALNSALEIAHNITKHTWGSIFTTAAQNEFNGSYTYAVDVVSSAMGTTKQYPVMGPEQQAANADGVRAAEGIISGIKKLWTTKLQQMANAISYGTASSDLFSANDVNTTFDTINREAIDLGTYSDSIQMDISNVSSLSTYFTGGNFEGQFGGFKKFIFFTKKLSLMVPAMTKIISSSLMTTYNNMDTELNKVGLALDTSINNAKIEISNITKSTSASSFFKGAPESTGMWSGLTRAAHFMGKIFLYPAYLIKTLNKKISSAYSNLQVSWAEVNVDGNSGGVDLPLSNPSIKNRINITKADSRKGTFKDKYGNIYGMGAPMDIYGTYTMTSPYGPRTLAGVSGTHTGIDLVKSKNAPIYSFTDGVVTRVDNQYAPDTGHLGSKDGSGYGNRVVVRDSTGKYNMYAHLNGTSVKVGDKVSEGTELGIQGHTGKSTGSHLHYEVRTSQDSNKTHINPLEHLKSYNSTSVVEPNSQNPSSTTTDTSNMTGIAAIVAEANNILSPLTDAMNEITGAANGFLAPILGTSSGPTTEESNSTTNSSVTPIVSGSDLIGNYVKQFESRKGSSAISSGSGDHGGVSFGQYQFPSYGKSYAKDSMLDQFWKKYYASKYPGVTPGDNEAFKKAWLDAVNSDPELFAKNEWSFVYPSYYKVMYDKLKSTFDPNTHSRAAQEMVWSTAVQYGMNSSVLKNALQGKSAQKMNTVDLINTIQDYKAQTVNKYFSSSSANVRKGVYNRHNKGEREALLAIASLPPLAVGGVDLPITTTTKNGVILPSREIFKTTAEYIRSHKPNQSTNEGSKSKIPEGIWDKLVEILSLIADNTGKTTEGIKELATNKPTNTTTVIDASKKTVKNDSTNPIYQVANDRRSEITNKNYRTAKLIAQGLN